MSDEPKKFIGRFQPIDMDSTCLYCLDELRRGVPADGNCGHEEQNARDRSERHAHESSSPQRG